MKSKKYIIVLCLLFLTTGCDLTYRINIDENINVEEVVMLSEDYSVILTYTSKPTEYIQKNLDDVKDEIMSLLSDIDNKEVEEIKKEEPPKTIYGGANPSANIKLDNEIKEKVPYEEKTIDLEKTEDLINTLNKETVKNEEEDIEVL